MKKYMKHHQESKQVENSEPVTGYMLGENMLQVLIHSEMFSAQSMPIVPEPFKMLVSAVETRTVTSFCGGNAA